MEQKVYSCYNIWWPIWHFLQGPGHKRAKASDDNIHLRTWDCFHHIFGTFKPTHEQNRDILEIILIKNLSNLMSEKVRSPVTWRQEDTAMVRGHLLSFLPSFNLQCCSPWWESPPSPRSLIKFLSRDNISGEQGRALFCTLGLGCEDVYNASDRALPVSLRRMQNLFVYKHVRPWHRQHGTKEWGDFGPGSSPDTLLETKHVRLWSIKRSTS